VYWVELLNWYTSPDSHDEAKRLSNETLAHFRRNQPKSMHTVYQNWTREDPVEWRYQGDKRLARLKELKEKWDSKGVFTAEFL